MRLNGMHFSGIGILLGILLFELWHKHMTGGW